MSAWSKCKLEAGFTALIKAKSNTDFRMRRHKWFWDKSIETKVRKDTYRYRVIEQATDITILPENEWYDPVEDEETKIEILFVGLPFKEHSKSHQRNPDLVQSWKRDSDSIVQSFCSCDASALMPI